MQRGGRGLQSGKREVTELYRGPGDEKDPGQGQSGRGAQNDKGSSRQNEYLDLLKKVIFVYILIFQWRSENLLN